MEGEGLEEVQGPGSCVALPGSDTRLAPGLSEKSPAGVIPAWPWELPGLSQAGSFREQKVELPTKPGKCCLGCLPRPSRAEARPQGGEGS